MAWHKASPVPLGVRLTWGAALLVAPGRILRLMGGGDEERADAADEGSTSRRIMRILGARHLVEGAAEAGLGGWAREVGVGVDVIHGLTDLAFGQIDRRWRRAAWTDAAISALFVAIGVSNR